jgi:hypothetical protein
MCNTTGLVCLRGWLFFNLKIRFVSASNFLCHIQTCQYFVTFLFCQLYFSPFEAMSGHYVTTLNILFQDGQRKIEEDLGVCPGTVQRLKMFFYEDTTIYSSFRKYMARYFGEYKREPQNCVRTRVTQIASSYWLLHTCHS